MITRVQFELWKAGEEAAVAYVDEVVDGHGYRQFLLPLQQGLTVDDESVRVDIPLSVSDLVSQDEEESDG